MMSVFGWILQFVPKNHLSFLVGKLVHLNLPKPFSSWSVLLFARYYNIRLEEAELPYKEYPSIGAFFVRRLKGGLRPISSATVVHPADSRISQIGRVDEGMLIQAKGKSYDVNSITGSMELHKSFFNGFFVTYYLCPTDYHRVHSPVEGKIIRATHIPGALWPVNEWSVNKIENLFGVNERVVVEIETELGVVALVFVGATNVGKMTMSFDSELTTNNLDSARSKVRTYNPPKPITRGEELGIFHMGSTVVMLYPEKLAPHAEDWHEWQGQVVKMGEAFTKPF